MKFRAWSIVLSLSATCAVIGHAADTDHELKKGDQLQTLANLHPDMNKHLVYTLNYQLPGIIPVCSDVFVTKVSKKKLSFTYQGIEYDFDYDNFTEGAGVSFQKAVQTYLGPACDRTKLASLGKKDQDGIHAGLPHVGMTRDGLLFAMGRPPYHANPDLTSESWTYWKNRFVREVIEFEDGKVSSIR